MASIFSRIISGEIPATKLYEDELTLAFLDVNPATRGHALVICKPELPSLLDLPPDLLAAVGRTTQRVARAIVTAVGCDGFTIVQNNGSAAGQTVFHYHVHIIPRWAGDQALGLWRPGSSEASELRALADLINAALSV